MASMGNETSFLELVGVSKAFPGVQALDAVSFRVNKGEIHALVGENGAGKSTLMKTIAGVYQPDAGELRLRGRLVKITNPEHARTLGISIIFQEFNLIPYLSVAENLFLGHEPKLFPGIIDRGALRREAIRAMELLNISIDPDVWVEELSVAQMQEVEILKALILDAELVIMDEPTAALTPMEVSHLFEFARNIRSRGKAVIFISHRLEEVLQIADRITVLKDGKVVVSMPTANMTKDDLVRFMVGRELSQTFPARASRFGPQPVLEIKSLSVGQRVQDVSLTAFPGEIVGIAGLEGHGQRELARALFGLEPDAKGLVSLNGRVLRLRTPSDAIKAGIGFVSDDRKGDGLALSLPIYQNVSLPNLQHLRRFFMFLERSREWQYAKAALGAVDLRASSLKAEVNTLSGGNQQKVVLAKWLPLRPSLLVFAEPTRGVDVGAKVEIWRLMRELASQGTPILMISSDLLEVIGVSDRVVVMYKGRVAREIPASECTEEKVMQAAAGAWRGTDRGSSAAAGEQEDPGSYGGQSAFPASLRHDPPVEELPGWPATTVGDENGDRFTEERPTNG